MISACSIETAVADKRKRSISGKRPGQRTWSCNHQLLIACHHRRMGALNPLIVGVAFKLEATKTAEIDTKSNRESD